jgi:hypothetical protein
MAMEIFGLPVVHSGPEGRMIGERIMRFTIFNCRLSVFHFPLA